MEDSSAYKLLIHVLQEQEIRDENEKYNLKETKDKSMNSSILQNPADPDTTYRHKAGKNYIGYCANLVESSNKTDIHW